MAKDDTGTAPLSRADFERRQAEQAGLQSDARDFAVPAAPCVHSRQAVHERFGTGWTGQSSRFAH